MPPAALSRSFSGVSHSKLRSLAGASRLQRPVDPTWYASTEWHRLSRGGPGLGPPSPPARPCRIWIPEAASCRANARPEHRDALPSGCAHDEAPCNSIEGPSTRVTWSSRPSSDSPRGLSSCEAQPAWPAGTPSCPVATPSDPDHWRSTVAVSVHAGAGCCSSLRHLWGVADSEWTKSSCERTACHPKACTS